MHYNCIHQCHIWHVCSDLRKSNASQGRQRLAQSNVLTIFSRPKPATDEAKGGFLFCAVLEENHMRVVVLMHLQRGVSVMLDGGQLWLCSI